MGLDMYLSARKHIEKISWKKVDEVGWENKDQAVNDEFNKIIESAGLTDTVSDDIYGASVTVNVAYWRKSNQIHGWFVRNVQRGEDDCGEYYVSNDKLTELLETCRQSLLHRDPSKLMPVSGFFFGGNDVDEWYWADIKDTITQLDRIIKLPDFDRLSFYYQSSW